MEYKVNVFNVSKLVYLAETISDYSQQIKGQPAQCERRASDDHHLHHLQSHKNRGFN